MQTEILHVVTCIFNYCEWKSRIRLYYEFENHMLESGASLTVVECQYDNRPFELTVAPGVQHIKVRASTPVWVKENLLNIGIEALPEDWKYMAWIDADLTFKNKAWVTDTIQALKQHPIVQPWETCHDLGPNGEHLAYQPSFCNNYQKVFKINPHIFPYGHSGYAWACTRQAYEWLGGLLELALNGAADLHMAMALVGKVSHTLPNSIHSNYAALIYAWQKRALQLIEMNISYVPGIIEHSWHGAKSKRQYTSRWAIMIDNAVDPLVDVVKNADGVLELAGNKPNLNYQLDRYFKTRDEDATVTG